jgi:hypothetical protein
MSAQHRQAGHSATKPNGAPLVEVGVDGGVDATTDRLQNAMGSSTVDHARRRSEQ